MGDITAREDAFRAVYDTVITELKDDKTAPNDLNK